MALITHRRNLRPETRQAPSSYKVDTENVTADDILRVEIAHQGEPVVCFEMPGAEVPDKGSIHFRACRSGTRWAITWIGVRPRKIYV